MRHHKKTRKFGREAKGRQALMRTLALSLISHDKIETTEAKAKELRPFIEPLVTKAKLNVPATRRYLASVLGSGSEQLAIEKLIETIAPKYEKRAGGYTRVIKTSVRKGDGSQMALIEFV